MPSWDRSNPVVQMDHMLSGQLVAQCLHVFATLGLADLIHAGTCTLEDLAVQTETAEDHLGRVLDTLTGNGVVRRSSNGDYGLTALADTLRSEVPHSLRHKAMFELSPPI